MVLMKLVMHAAAVATVACMPVHACRFMRMHARRVDNLVRPTTTWLVAGGGDKAKGEVKCNPPRQCGAVSGYSDVVNFYKPNSQSVIA
jgi:hypothetical protein